MRETPLPEIVVRIVDEEDEVAVEMTIASVAHPAVDAAQLLQDQEEEEVVVVVVVVAQLQAIIPTHINPM
jgi:hypothetical protein